MIWPVVVMVLEERHLEDHKVVVEVRVVLEAMVQGAMVEPVVLEFLI